MNFKPYPRGKSLELSDIGWHQVLIARVLSTLATWFYEAAKWLWQQSGEFDPLSHRRHGNE